MAADMARNQMAYIFLKSAKDNRKRIRFSAEQHETIKGYVDEVSMEDGIVTVVVEGEEFTIDLNTSEVRVAFFDSRSIVINGEKSFRMRLG